MNAKERDRAEAIEALRELGVKPGTRIYTSVSHVARSGMSRHLHCYLPVAVTRQGKREVCIRTITHLVARAIGDRMKDDAILNGDCGTDAGFHTVYRLGRVMFPKGGSLTKTSGRETDGGYLLCQEWL